MYVCKLRARLARKLPLGALKYVNPIFIYYMCVGNICTIRPRGRRRSRIAYKQGKTRKMRHTGAEYIYTTSTRVIARSSLSCLLWHLDGSLCHRYDTLSQHTYGFRCIVCTTLPDEVYYTYIYISISIYVQCKTYMTYEKEIKFYS